MKYFGEKAGELHKELSRIIRKPAEFDRARQLFLNLHAMLHTSIVSGGEYGETDCLLSDLAESDFYTTPLYFTFHLQLSAFGFDIRRLK